MLAKEGEVVALFFNPPGDRPVAVGSLTFSLHGVLNGIGKLDRWGGAIEIVNQVPRRNTALWRACSLDETGPGRVDGGVTFCVRGIEGFSELTRGSRLHFPLDPAFKDDPELGPVTLSVEDEEQLVLPNGLTVCGLTGVVHQAGRIAVGSRVEVELALPKLRRSRLFRTVEL